MRAIRAPRRSVNKRCDRERGTTIKNAAFTLLRYGTGPCSFSQVGPIHRIGIRVTLVETLHDVGAAGVDGNPTDRTARQRTTSRRRYSVDRMDCSPEGCFLGRLIAAGKLRRKHV